ncbi:MAG: Fic family protein, partial [Candidatus Ornithospirochaeta sp.]
AEFTNLQFSYGRSLHIVYDVIPITKNYILQLHKILYSHLNNPFAGETKNVQNYISSTYTDGRVEILFSPLEPFETPEALDRICEEYNRVIGNLEVEPLIAIPVFIHDFLCIHPFNDGNGRMSRLLTTLLLYRNGFHIGKYISLEAKIAKNKDLYYDALFLSQAKWHEGKEDVVPFIKYLLGTILAAYNDFEDRMSLVEVKYSALEMVRRATLKKLGRFNKQDIRELCPTLSDSSIEGGLRKLVTSGELKKEGKGKNTCYFRLN